MSPSGHLRIVVPFTVRHPDVEQVLAPFDPSWAYVGDDPHDYWRLLCAEWNRSLDTGEDLLVVEHDVAIRPDVIEHMQCCPEPWCVFGYDPICHPQCQEAWANMLGCTRFRSELIAACPEALRSIPEALRDWHNLCDHLAGNKLNGTDLPRDRWSPMSLRANGFTHHWHSPPVRHISWEGHIR